MHGFTENDVRVQAKYDPLLINEKKEVLLDKISETGYVTVLEPEFVI
jgi:threonylcarbamoyladenosine tRNA methylthiotransferase MtaB